MIRSVLVSIWLIGIATSVIASERPNFIVILADDLGYGDLECYGADDVSTPQINQMAHEGATCTSFYVSPVCSPTRAALMTGCSPQRVGINGVLFPRSNHGLNPDEITLPELLKQQGYTTAIIGKWHLGNQQKFQPLRHGFDIWYGTPSSNSQGYYPTIKKYSDDCVYREGYTSESILQLKEAKCPLLRNNLVIEVPADQTQFTQRYTREAIEFITKNQEKPFFVYLPHNMVHIPLHASDEFIGSSQRGIYGDAIQELDWSTGEILKALKDLGLDDNTLVIFTSDNGPNLQRQGRALPLRGGKGSTYEGGVRVPCVARWPGKIPPGLKVDAPITVMDLLPTLVRLAGGETPTDRVIDGKDIWPLLAGEPDAASPHEAIYYTRGRSVAGIRVGDWKYQPSAGKDKADKKQAKQDRAKKQPEPTLYDLRTDIGEQHNLVLEQPNVVARLKEMMEAYRDELRSNLRPAGIAD